MFIRLPIVCGELLLHHPFDQHGRLDLTHVREIKLKDRVELVKFVDSLLIFLLYYVYFLFSSSLLSEMCGKDDIDVVS